MIKKLIIAFVVSITSTIALSQPVVTPPAFIPPPSGVVIPAFNNAQTNWQKAGLQSIGGIPTRNTQCGTTIVPTGNPPPASNDDANTLTNALAAANPATCNVVLFSGHFIFDVTETLIHQNSGITLRGVGTCNSSITPPIDSNVIIHCPTYIDYTNGLLPWAGKVCGGGNSPCCGTSIATEVACNNFHGGVAMWPPSATYFGTGNPAEDFDWAGQNAVGGGCSLVGSAVGCGTALDADAVANGSNATIQVHSTTGFSAGMMVLIDEASGALFINDLGTPASLNYGQVYAAPDTFATTGSPITGKIVWPKFSNVTFEYGTGNYPGTNPGLGATHQALWDRATSEVKRISSVGVGTCPGLGCTITFDSPLMMNYRASGMTTFTGSISGMTLTTTSGDNCTLQAGQIVDDSNHVTADGTYVTAVNSCSAGAGNYTVSISQTVSSRTLIGGAHQAHVYFPVHNGGTAYSGTNGGMGFEIGLENFTIYRAPNTAIVQTFCVMCWVHGVELVGWTGGAVNFNESLRGQVDFTYANNCYVSHNDGAEYPIGMQNSSTEGLVFNNIIRQCGKGMVGKAGAGFVVAYNYQDQQMYDNTLGATANYFLDLGANGSHWAGTNHYLFEGNYGTNCDGDNTHGNTVYITFYRNWCTGLRTDFNDPSMVATGGYSSTLVSDAQEIGYRCSAGPTMCVLNGSTGFQRAAGPEDHNYWYAYTGNVLGLNTISGHSISSSSWTYQGSVNNTRVIWMSGWINNGGGAGDANLNGTNTPQFLTKNCNYDYFNNSVVDCNAGLSHTLPNSLYLTNTPSFFGPGVNCTYSYPWVTAQSATVIQNTSGSGCTVGPSLPALARFNAGTPFVQP